MESPFGRNARTETPFGQRDSQGGRFDGPLRISPAAFNAVAQSLPRCVAAHEHEGFRLRCEVQSGGVPGTCLWLWGRAVRELVHFGEYGLWRKTTERRERPSALLARYRQ
jgi:hypothetical protein